MRTRLSVLCGVLAAGAMLVTQPVMAVVVFSGEAGVDPGNDAVYVGGAVSGSATVSSPGIDSFSTVTLGTQFSVGASGSLLVSGVGAVLRATNVVNVGGSGSGSMRIESGGVVESLGGESPFCPGCNATIIANGGGSIGNVVVTGAGSRFDVGDSLGNSTLFIVGHGAVTPSFGTSGAPTSGTFSVLDGGTAATLSTFIGNANGLDPGSEFGRSQTTGLVTINGAGSHWTVAPLANGIPAFIGVGNNGTGTLNITGGARVDTTHMQVGRNDGSSGALHVGGADSLLQMVGGDATYGGAGFVVGWHAGATGTVMVDGGGRVHIDGTDAGGAAGFTLGGLPDGPGGSGTMTVAGAGSLVEIIGNSSAGLPSGFTVGATGTGHLSVLEGGRIVVIDNSPDAFGSFSIGGNLAQAQAGTAAGNGTMFVAGAGSEVDVRSAHGSFRVGHTSGGGGTVNVEAGGKIKAASGILGETPGSVGTMTITGAASRVELAGDSYGFGAFLVVAAAGVGTLDVLDGGTLDIHASSTTPLGGMAIGGTRTQAPEEAGGVGTVNVSGAGRILVSGDLTTHIKLGVHADGTGLMNVSGGGQVIIGRPLDPGAAGDESGFYVAPAVGAIGAAVVQGTDSLIDGGVFIGVGVDVDKVSDAGIGVLTVRDGGQVVADAIRIGSHGVLNGNGFLHGNVTNAGVIAPGNSPGTLTIDGSLISTGRIDIEVVGLADGEFDVLNVLGGVQVAGSTIRFLFTGGYVPRAGDSFDFLTGTSAAAPLAGAVYAYSGLRDGFVFSVDADTGVFRAINDAAPVPEPATWLMLGVGAGVLAFARSRTRVSRDRLAR